MRFRHRYEVDPQYIERLEAGGLVFSGKAPDYPIMQILELPASMHPYFIATQAHPEFQSRPLRPQPLFLGLVKAALARAEAGDVGRGVEVGAMGVNEGSGRHGESPSAAGRPAARFGVQGSGKAS